MHNQNTCATVASSLREECGELAEKFEASRYLTRVNGRDYLEVKWRLLWLRTEHPEAMISTELMEHEDGLAVFKAKVTIPGGGEATGWGSESLDDFGDYIEKAETKALGRACAALGYGTQFCEDFDFHARGESVTRVVDSPIERPRGLVTKERSSANSRATPAQVKAIYVIGRSERQWTEEELDTRCREMYGNVPSELSRRQASEFIDRLKGNAPSLPS